ncbi:MAG: signal peptidase II [Candidatus Bipolaricaulota bacterium]|nr:signal peptidase II [Candidatus Bipolaricaulota bacterium]
MGKVFCLLGAGVVIGVDRLLKFWVEGSLELGRSCSLLDGAVSLRRVHNPGGALGIFASCPNIFLIVAAVVSTGLFIAVLTADLPGPLVKVGVSLLLGGAVGNLIDRLLFGYVIDFILVYRFPVFNLADACIVIGVGLILLRWLL